MTGSFPFAASLALVAAAHPVAQTKEARPLTPKEAAAEFARLYRDDQQDQQEWETADGRDAEFGARQRERRERVIAILQATELEDLTAWENAAGLLLHGKVVGDFLLAHVLSIPAGVEKVPFGRFTTAAGLDRYLENLGRQQVFGTQFYAERPEDVRYEAYPEHFVPEPLRQLFEAGPPLVVERQEKEDRAKPPKPGEIRDLARKVAKPRAEDVPAELHERARSAVRSAGKLDFADLAAAAEVLGTSREPDDLLLAHVCAVAAAFEAPRKKKDREAALELCSRTIDGWLLAIGEPPLFEEPKEGGKQPVPPLPGFVKRRFLGN